MLQSPHSSASPPGANAATTALNGTGSASRQQRRRRQQRREAPASPSGEKAQESFIFFWFSGAQFFKAKKRRAALANNYPQQRARPNLVGAKDNDLPDLSDFLESDVDGTAVEDELTTYWPIFIVLQCFLVFSFWFFSAMVDTNWSSEAFAAVGGLELLFPGRTTLVVHSDCDDLRHEVWRWWTYQFTHSKCSHVASNVFLAVVAGIPLEGFIGTLRTMTFFTLGVFGGAAGHAVSNPHAGSSPLNDGFRVVGLVGMSGGCYALLGIHMGSLIMNFREMKYRWPMLLGLLVLIALDVLHVQLDSRGKGLVAHSAHLGGYMAGLLLSIPLGRNLQWTRKEMLLAFLAALLALGLSTFCLVWWLQWPPRSVHDPVPWCMARQVNNRSVFGDREFHCVRCPDRACMRRWLQQTYVETVDHEICSQRRLWWGET